MTGTPYLDAEKIPPDQLGCLFRQPPGIPVSFARNTLLVGARGAGKTTLLKNMAQRDIDSTIYISLIEELGTISAESVQIGNRPNVQGPSLYSKSAILMALALLRIADEQNLAPELPRVAALFPSTIQPQLDDDAPTWVRRTTASMRTGRDIPDSFDSSRLLYEVASAIALKYHSAGLQLCILMDRADMVPLRAVQPSLDLLDQTGSYTLVIATRPCPQANPHWGVRSAVVPLDHYDVCQLGAVPSHIWSDFVRTVIAGQLSRFTTDVIPDDIIQYAIAIAHDSIRFALEILYYTSCSSSKSWPERLRNTLVRSQGLFLQQACTRLSQWHSDFRATVRDWRANALQAGLVTASTPVIFRITRKQLQLDLLGQSRIAEIDSLIARSLEDSVLLVAPGATWTPGSRLAEFQVAPLLLWAPDQHAVVHREPEEPIRVSLTESSFARHSGGPRKRDEQIFVALRFQFRESEEFFVDLQKALAQHPELGHVKITTGRVPPGTLWASDIRKRIERSRRLVVGDVTGMRGDVLFEVGMAAGLQRTVLPVVHVSSNVTDCPFWLRAIQLARYGDARGLAEIVGAIHMHVRERQRTSSSSAVEPTPGRALWLHRARWNQHAYEQAVKVARSEGIILESVERADESNYEHIIELTMRSRLVVVCFDGTAEDSFLHYACGLVMARPETGYGTKRLIRRVIVLKESSGVDVPDSIKRCHPNVNCCKEEDNYLEQLKNFCAEYSIWRESGDPVS